MEDIKGASSNCYVDVITNGVWCGSDFAAKCQTFDQQDSLLIPGSTSCHHSLDPYGRRHERCQQQLLWPTIVNQWNLSLQHHDVFVDWWFVMVMECLLLVSWLYPAIVYIICLVWYQAPSTFAGLSRKKLSLRMSYTRGEWKCPDIRIVDWPIRTETEIFMFF